MNTELIKALRQKTAAGMADCRSALEAASWDFDKAVDIIKIKGADQADSRSSKPAAEGVIALRHSSLLACCIEVNSQTDFTSRSPEFIALADQALNEFANALSLNEVFTPSAALEEARKNLVAKTKENIVIRRWMAEEAIDPNARVFSYLHNGKIAVLLTLLATSKEQADSPEFNTLGEETCLQLASMGAIAVSIDQVSSEIVDHQKSIFTEQVKELGKPEVSWPKIIEGKMRKWQTEACLLDQESVMHPKKSIKQLLGDVKVSQFHRMVVGEGIEVETKNLAEEVAKTIGE